MRIVCWGGNAYGELGDGTQTDSDLPVSVQGITTATAVTAGGLHTCALQADGTVLCWGSDSSNDVGSPYCSSQCSTPEPVRGFD